MRWFSFKKTPRIVAPSSIHGTISVGNSFGKKALFAGNFPQSGGEFVYMFDTIIKKIKEVGFTPCTCLLLGVAGGTVIEAIHAYYPRCIITGIEIDPALIDVAKKQFSLKENAKTKIIIADAVAWVQAHNKSKQYDLVIADLFIGELNAPHVREKPFLLQLKNIVSSQGVILYNSHYQKRNKEDFKTFKQRLSQVFSTVEETFAYPKNRVLLLHRS